MSSIVNEASVKPVKTASQKKQGRMALLLLAILVFGVGIAYQFLLAGDESFTLSDFSKATVIRQDLVKTGQASGTVQLPNQIVVTSPNDGYSSRLLVSLGEAVVKDQVIAEIDVPDLDEDIEDYEAELIVAQVDRERVILEHQHALANSAADIASLEKDLLDLKEDEAKYIKLVAINNARKSELEDIQDELDDKREELADAKRALVQSKASYRVNLKETEALLAKTQISLAHAKSELEDTRIKSPIDGEVLEIQDEISVSGSTLDSGDELFTIADPQSVIFDLEISEEYTGAIAIGDPVEVTVSSMTVSGTISSIGKVAQTSSDGLGASVQVEVTPDSYNSNLLLGATAIGLFTLGVEEGALTLPRGAYITTGGQKYVYVIQGDRAVKTSVTFGEIESNTVQILTGVKAGDQIITSGYQNFISQSEIKLAGE